MAITVRTGERLCRQALEMEALAIRLEDGGYGDESSMVREIAEQSGRAGCRLLNKLELFKYNEKETRRDRSAGAPIMQIW